MMVNMFHQFQVIYIQQFSWCFDAFLGSIFQILLYKGVNQQDYHNFDTLSIQGAPWRLDFGICGLHVHFAILCLEKAREKANMLHVEAGVSNLRMCCLTSGPGKDKGVGEKLPVEVKALKMRTMTRLMESRWREN